MNQMRSRPIEILLIEDNPADADLVQEIFEECKIRNALYIVSNGIEALEFLQKDGKYGSLHHPDVILLDLNLPLMDGRELLQRIKTDPDLKHIPVVVLTTSNAERDILQSYSLHANCFITKPLDLDQFVEVVRSIEHFWLTIVKLPEE